MLEDKVSSFVENALRERTDLFLIDLSVTEANHIKVVIDGDKGVLVDDCIFISRSIEHNLDRDATDFSLEVTSAGATSPLKNQRQYKKNIGRLLKVKTNTEEYEGKLTAVDNESIILEWKQREPKKIGKGKVTVQKSKKLEYNNIIKANVRIKF